MLHYAVGVRVMLASIDGGTEEMLLYAVGVRVMLASIDGGTEEMHHSDMVHLKWLAPCHSVTDSFDMTPPLTVTLTLTLTLTPTA